MAQGSDAAELGLGMPAAAQGGEVRFGAGTSDGPLGAAAVRQALAGAGRGGPGLAPENAGLSGHRLVGLLANGLGAVNVGSRELARQPHPGAGHGDALAVGVLRGDLWILYGDAGTFAGRDDELVGLLPDGLGVVYDSSGNFARQPRSGGGRAEGIVAALRGPNSAATLAEAEHLRRLLPVAGIAASSAAVIGLAAGTASPAAGLCSLALLLGGLSLRMIHMLHV